MLALDQRLPAKRFNDTTTTVAASNNSNTRGEKRKTNRKREVRGEGARDTPYLSQQRFRRCSEAREGLPRDSRSV